MNEQQVPDADGADDSATDGIPSSVAEAAAADSDSRHAKGLSQPAWADRFVWQSLWKVVAVAFAVALLLVVGFRAQHLLRLLGISVFFALAMVPAVNFMERRWGWKRGAGVALIYAGVVAFVAFMVLLLIPGISEFATQVGAEGDEWAAELNTWTEDTLGVTVIDQTSADDAATSADSAISSFSDEILGAATSAAGLVFDLATIALFTFYFTADYQRIERALMSRMPPARQRVYGWVSDTALEQTGGYFYSRLLLMIVNGALFFGAMLVIGMPVVFALPLSVFESFMATFIPAVGTYIGAAVPILIALAVQGFVPALALLIFTLIYQQIENYWLSPKLSAQTMELNGGVAFGAALAGGAIAGPMGAFMALPVAALITSVISNLGQSYEVVYESRFDTETLGDHEPE